MLNVPMYLNILFVLITLLTIVLFYFASKKNNYLLLLTLFFAALQGILAQKGFFMKTDSLPPRIMLVIVPAILLIIIAFNTKAGKRMIDSFDLEKYTYLHTIRVAVEFTILGLFFSNLMPRSMTFEGRNFDVISGISAPLVAYLVFNRKIAGRKFLLIWNIVCLILVMQVVITGILSVPSPVQQMSFADPNVGILVFPFVWLPGIVVPVVIFGHLVALRKLIYDKLP